MTHQRYASPSRHDSCLFVTWRRFVCDMTHSPAAHACQHYHPHKHHHPHITLVTWPILVCNQRLTEVDITTHTWLIPMCDKTHYFDCDMTHSPMARQGGHYHPHMTHAHVWQDWFSCMIWIIHQRLTHVGIIIRVWFMPICDMTHCRVWHGSFMCVTWLIHVCDMTLSCVWHDSLSCVTWLIHTLKFGHGVICIGHLYRSFSAKQPLSVRLLCLYNNQQKYKT